MTSRSTDFAATSPKTFGGTTFTSALSQTQTFHARPQWPDPISTYTVFHGEEKPLPTYVPKYFVSPDTAALANRHGSSLYSFRATAERTGVSADGRPSYRFGGVGAATLANPPSSTSTLARPLSNTLGSTGLPPVPYKAHSTEYLDEYREPVEHLDTLRTLTHKFNTTGGTRVTKRSTRSDGQPNYETRVVAF